ncbi:MAG: cytidine deaminase [Bacteroidales bacterium]|jgi:cytidine deaminase|nr:cytidine deaminase [Bacteroidales bacterium]
MKKRSIEIHYSEYDSRTELPTDDRKLLEMATDATHHAYAPYSGFHVGAAIKLKNGKYFLGNNQENASFPAGICAERSVLFYTSANYPGEVIESIAITAKARNFDTSEPVSPCGICRQVMAEYEKLQKSPIRIILAGSTGSIYIADSAADLLPLQFSGENLKK